MTTTVNKLPQWIWGSGSERSIVLSKTFELQDEIDNIEYRIALTGAVKVELNGVILGELSESAANLCEFHRIKSFPPKLEAGTYTLRLYIACEQPMPIVPINIHLQGRELGCIAYLHADDFWLCTDDTWHSEDTPVKQVCLLGEEPYGDLENGLDWFIAGGFGDIQATPLESLNLISANQLEVRMDNGIVRLSGTGKGRISLGSPARNALHIFYHVRKQTEWQEMNQAVRQFDFTMLPSCLLDLGKIYNMRFHIKNNSASAVRILWIGAESLHELEHYEGLITESFELQPQEEVTSLPQGLRYYRFYAAMEDDQPLELEWQAEEVGVPLVQVGSLQTDSEFLRDIYDVSLHTNRVCHQLGLWDGIKRDRLNWAYDFYLAAKADYVLWDNLDVLRRSMEELGRGTPEGYWMNDIPAYTLWWINNVWEYYLHTADQAFVLSMQADLERHCALIKRNIDPSSNRLLHVTPTLLEWVPMKPEEGELSMQALLRLTGANLFKLKSSIPELAHIPDWGYPELDGASFLSGEQLITKLLGIMAGYVDKDEAEVFLRQYTVQDPITPLSAYWLADCCSEFGLQDKAWEIISKVWGKMLSEGATATWESVTLKHEGDFHQALTTYTAYGSYRISLCHSWASTPIHWIMSRLVGVRPLEPGYRIVAIRPQRIHGMNTCIGTIPTPYGLIRAGWDKHSDETIVELPEGVRVLN